MRALEKKVQAAAAKALPAVVAVRNPRPPEGKGPRRPDSFASGVIISADGLIVSQYHVSHRTGERDWGGVPPKGTKTVVIFLDGTQAEAELLGADLFNDLSLLRLTERKKYPCAAPDGAAPRLGDVVLKIGHPLGYRPGRTPPVRLGRVVAAAEPFFVTDCPTLGGDSGGPFFDLEGRLIGIVRNSTVPTSVHGAGGAARARGVIPFSVTPSAVVRARLDALREGKIVGELISESKEAKQFDAALQAAEALPAARWSRGAETLAGYHGVASDACRGVVTVLDGDDPVALGTVVEDRLVLTKASQLPDKPACRLPGGEVVAAEVVGVDPAFDLALLRVKAEGMRPVEWSAANPPIGSLLVAPGPGGDALAAGVVSVARRDVKAPVPKSVIRLPRGPAVLPSVLGSPVEGRGYWVELVEGATRDAGIRPGDVIVSIAGTPIREHSDLAAAVTGRRGRDRVPVALLREGKPLQVTLTLKAMGGSLFNGRPGDFPTVIEHDLPLTAEECGGPVVGLDGRAVGVTVARVNAHGCQAVPAEIVRRLLPDLKAGKPLGGLAAPPLAAKAAPPPPPPEGKPVSVDIDEIKRRLKERGDHFRHLYVDYETVLEPVVEPAVLASWGINPPRQTRERQQFAFSGEKRMSEVTRPGVSVYWVPPTEVTPAKEAPPEVARRIEQARRQTAANAQASGVASWFLGIGKDPIRQRSVFDGADAYLRMAGGMPAVKLDAALFVSDPVYLIGLGLRPPDPKPRTDVRRAQERMWFPGNFAGYDEARVRPRTEAVDGAACVAVEASSVSPRAGGPLRRQTETLWLDPALGYAPRRWEVRDDGVLATRRTNARFEEFEPGCWLPWEAAVETGPPAWVAKEYHDRPAYRQVIRLKRAVVNRPKTEWFQP